MEVQKKEDGSITLSFYTGPQQKKISIIFPKRTTKNELLIALQETGMVLTKGVQYYTKNMLIELYGYNSKQLREIESASQITDLRKCSKVFEIDRFELSLVSKYPRK
jgi:hypothetical protein